MNYVNDVQLSGMYVELFHFFLNEEKESVKATGRIDTSKASRCP